MNNSYIFMTPYMIQVQIYTGFLNGASRRNPYSVLQFKTDLLMMRSNNTEEAFKMQKQLLRAEILTRRSQLTDTKLAELSSQVFNQLLASKILDPAQIIMLYMDFKDEVRTAEIIEYLWRQGKTVVIPRVNKKEDRLDLFKIASFNEMTRSSFGILEPSKELMPDIQPDQIDLILSPGVAFDTVGNRIGYGGGYYDKLLPHIQPSCVVCGLAFELQIVAQGLIPVEPHDVPLHYVVTDSRILKFAASKHI